MRILQLRKQATGSTEALFKVILPIGFPLQPPGPMTPVSKTALKFRGFGVKNGFMARCNATTAASEARPTTASAFSTTVFDGCAAGVLRLPG